MDFKEHLKKYLTDLEIESLIKSFENNATHALYLNTNKMNEDTLKSIFKTIEKHPFVDNGYYFNRELEQPGKSIYHLLGCYYIQEPSAMLVSNLLDPKPNEKILDLCAAPGGKSIQCALKMQNTGLLISNDLSHKRCLELLENIERLGISNTIVTNNDFSKIYKNFNEYFDKIILDAPCSGSGMFRKNDAMMQDWTYDKVLKYSEIQKELILNAFDMLKIGGKMVYSTCSYSYEEDEEVITYLLENRPEANVLKIEENPSFYKDPKTGFGIHLFPSKFQGEGHYICLISKGELVSSIQDNSKNDFKNIRTFDSLNKIKYQLFGDTKFALDFDAKTKGLNIVRFGINFSQIKGKDEIYSYHLAHCIDQNNSSSLRACDINISYARTYCVGNVISNDNHLPNGPVLITYKGIPLSFGKVVNNQIKNHFPKNLRQRKYDF